MIAQDEILIKNNIVVPLNGVSESNKRRSNSMRKAAKLAGEIVYSVDKPCKFGHISKRYIKNSQCVECSKIRTANNRARNPKLFEAYNRKSWLKKTYSISIEHYETLLNLQNNKCAICEKELTERPHIDHCHKSGKIRGLLCSNCNRGIGHFKDSPKLLIKASLYCERNS